MVSIRAGLRTQALELSNRNFKFTMTNILTMELYSINNANKKVDNMQYWIG